MFIKSMVFFDIIENLKGVNSLVATGCPMCKIQLQYGLRKTDVKVVHPVQLLARTFSEKSLSPDHKWNLLQMEF